MRQSLLAGAKAYLDIKPQESLLQVRWCLWRGST